MKAAVVEHYKEPLIVENVTEPTHDQDGVLVEENPISHNPTATHG